VNVLWHRKISLIMNSILALRSEGKFGFFGMIED
jgi:hypothetical protein